MIDIPYKTAALLWMDRLDSIDIARSLRISEAAVWNAMGLIRATAAAMRETVKEAAT